jgi:NADH-quinone oxidoreductase subunit N
MVWLAVVAVFFSIIGVYYYLRLIKLMYFDEVVEDQPLVCSRDMQITLSTNALLILALGLYPAGLMSLCMGVFG